MGGTGRLSIRRVFLVVPELTRLSGAVQHSVALAMALATDGLDVSVFCLTPLPATSRYRRLLPASGVRLVVDHPTAHRGGVVTEIDASLDALTQPSPLAGFRRRYRRSAATAAPDVVHVHGFRLETAAAAAIVARDGFPVVYTEHATLGEGDDQFGPIADAAWEYLATVDVVSCVSRQTADVVSAILPAGHPIVLARQPVAGPTSPVRPRRRSADAALSVVCLSRFSAEKGLEVLVDAATLLQRRAVPFRMTLAGIGTRDQELVNRIRALGLANAVEVLGGYAPGEAPHVLASADVVVSPSYTEGLPLALLEAMAQGVPAVATDVGGTSEIITHEVNGLLVPAGDAEATATALTRLAEDEALRVRLAEQARRTFEAGGYSPREAATHTRQLYSHAIARATRRRSASISRLYRTPYSRVAPSVRRWREGWFS